MNNVKYPEIEVQLVGQDGNAMVIISRVRGALSSAGVSREEVTEFTNEAMSGDYNNVLQTAMRWVSVS